MFTASEQQKYQISDREQPLSQQMTDIQTILLLYHFTNYSESCLFKNCGTESSFHLKNLNFSLCEFLKILLIFVSGIDLIVPQKSDQDLIMYTAI